MSAYVAKFLTSISDIEATSWNALAGSSQPFLTHEFLLALEETGCVTPATGWTPQHLILHDADGLVGAMPLYRKENSRGEFVFDFAWANAYAENGLRYYPKLVSAIPFTPVQGGRLLKRPGADASAIDSALITAVHRYAEAKQLSSWHILFPTPENLVSLEKARLILRKDCQFHWHNQDYSSFDAFLATFTAEKRKKAKRERRRVAEAGIEFDTLLGGEVDDALWDTLYGFYADTFYRHGHEPYINLLFFKRIARILPDKIMLKIARHGNLPIAVAIFFIGSDALYGRYWGASGNFHSLHFETCYYQGIEYCIEHKLKRFEPGTQGEHKVPRGFVPTLTGSAHAILDDRFAAAIRDFARRECRGVLAYAAAVNEHVPYHQSVPEELRL